MPFCDVSKCQKAGEGKEGDSGIKIFYRTYGRGRTKVLLLIGLAGTHEGWGPQVKGLAGTHAPNEEEAELDERDGGGSDEESQGSGGVEVCCFDNRGMGQSSVPAKKSEYTTTKMANDTLALLDHLGWKRAHVIGHSMGAMIACKLAAMVPDRLLSLGLLNVTGGGFECFPKVDREFISIALRFLRAKTPEQRAMVDLETHYTKEYLDENLGSSTRRQILYQEYVNAISSTGMQSNYGFEGQVNACWTHSMSSKELSVIRSAGFLVLVLHGRYDIIAQVRHARKLANRLHPAARMVELQGAHLVSHERPEEVNSYLLELINASESRKSHREWTGLIQNENGGLTAGVPFLSNKSGEEEVKCFMYSYDSLAKLQLMLLYFIGLFIIAFKHARRVAGLLKPTRVEASCS